MAAALFLGRFTASVSNYAIEADLLNLRNLSRSHRPVPGWPNSDEISPRVDLRGFHWEHRANVGVHVLIVVNPGITNSVTVFHKSGPRVFIRWTGLRRLLFVEAAAEGFLT